MKKKQVVIIYTEDMPFNRAAGMAALKALIERLNTLEITVHSFKTCEEALEKFKHIKLQRERDQTLQILFITDYDLSGAGGVMNGRDLLLAVQADDAKSQFHTPVIVQSSSRREGPWDLNLQGKLNEFTAPLIHDFLNISSR
jgi:hypothetical protein